MTIGIGVLATNFALLIADRRAKMLGPATWIEDGVLRHDPNGYVDNRFKKIFVSDDRNSALAFSGHWDFHKTYIPDVSDLSGLNRIKQIFRIHDDHADLEARQPSTNQQEILDITRLPDRMVMTRFTTSSTSVCRESWSSESGRLPMTVTIGIGREKLVPLLKLESFADELERLRASAEGDGHAPLLAFFSRAVARVASETTDISADVDAYLLKAGAGWKKL